MLLLLSTVAFSHGVVHDFYANYQRQPCSAVPQYFTLAALEINYAHALQFFPLMTCSQSEGRR